MLFKCYYIVIANNFPFIKCKVLVEMVYLFIKVINTFDIINNGKYFLDALIEFWCSINSFKLLIRIKPS